MKVLLSATAAWLLLLVLPPAEHPDAASVWGRVSDVHGTAIWGATISLRDRFSSEVWYTTSDREGIYKIGAMKQGRYSVLVEAPGYVSTWIPNVFLLRGQQTELNVVLPCLREDGKRPPA